MSEKEKCLWCGGLGAEVKITDYSIKITSNICTKCKGLKIIEREKNNHEKYQKICPKCNACYSLIARHNKINNNPKCELCGNTGLIDWIDEIKNGKYKK